MDEKIREALGSLRMPQESADRALEGISRRLRPSRRRPVKLALALCGVLVFLMAAGGWTYFTPTAYLSVDSAAACELRVNCFGRVVGVEAHTPQGEALAGELAVPFVGYAEAVEHLLSQEEGGAAITVTGSSQSQCHQILQQVEEDTASRGNVTCHGATLEEWQQAQQAGMSLGKYRIYAQIAALDPTFTQEEAASLSMSQLRQRLEELTQSSASGESGSSQEESAPVVQGHHDQEHQQEHGQSQGSGQGVGQGQGTGAAQGSGQGAGQGQGTGQNQGAGQGQGQHRGRE